MSTAVFAPDLVQAAGLLLAKARQNGLRITTAESCTGGLIAALLTDVAGSSDVFERGFVSYSNAAKVEMLGVPPALIDTHGAVSAPVACAMAEGALHHCPADIAIAVTGIAGPGGGSAAKPVGLVQFACARRGGATVQHEARYGDCGRSMVRFQTVAKALQLLAAAIDGPKSV